MRRPSRPGLRSGSLGAGEELRRSARRRLAAIAVPGDHAWQPKWARLLAGREVTIVMDADQQGRAAAERIADELADHARTQIVDVAPRRTDGYDLTDWLLEHGDLAGDALIGRPLAPLGR